MKPETVSHLFFSKRFIIFFGKKERKLVNKTSLYYYGKRKSIIAEDKKKSRREKRQERNRIENDKKLDRKMLSPVMVRNNGHACALLELKIIYPSFIRFSMGEWKIVFVTPSNYNITIYFNQLRIRMILLHLNVVKKTF